MGPEFCMFFFSFLLCTEVAGSTPSLPLMPCGGMGKTPCPKSSFITFPPHTNQHHHRVTLTVTSLLCSPASSCSSTERERERAARGHSSGERTSLDARRKKKKRRRSSCGGSESRSRGASLQLSRYHPPISGSSVITSSETRRLLITAD